MARSREQLIRQLSRRRGIDPSAAVAVASVEGSAALHGGISVGDGGTSFGPFQLHRGGALPSGKGSDWAHSNQGVDYAISRMASAGCRGLKGRAAVTCIVRNFERPAAPGAEIQKAMGFYRGGKGGGLGAMSPNGGMNAMSPNGGMNAMSPNGVTGGDFKAQAVAYLLDNAQRAARGEGPNMDALLGLAMARQASNGAAPEDTFAPAAHHGGGGGISPAPGKLIGTPYKGTHTLGNWESDNAVDVRMPVGTPLRAEADGVIGNQFGSLGSGGRFAGKRLHLQTGNNEYYYAHMSRYAPGIKPGARVKKGQIIGYSGSANGVPHLHLGARRGNPVNLYR